jgi:hypothetical protein
MSKINFKERIKNVIINEAKAYKQNYVDYEYLICSDAFVINEYYIIDAKEDNYQHLTGVHALISPQDFFNKCLDGTLSEDDFDFAKKGQTEKSVKGSVRRKIQVLPDMMNLFQKNIIVEETFEKNKIKCAFATTDKSLTLGFTDAYKSRPMTLIKGDELDINKAQNVKLLLRKEVKKQKFDEIIIGDDEILMTYYEKIKNLIDESLIPISISESESEVAVTG